MSQRICRHGDKVANMETAEKKREYRRKKRLHRKGDVLKGEWGCYDGIRIIGDDGKELHGVLSPTVLSQQFVKQVFHGGGGGI